MEHEFAYAIQTLRTEHERLVLHLRRLEELANEAGEDAQSIRQSASLVRLTRFNLNKAMGFLEPAQVVEADS